MTVQKVSRISILPFGLVNAHIVSTSSGCILVDTGLPGSEGKIGKALSALGLTFKDIKLIIVTHAHVDHAGGAALMRELSGAPILAHAGDAKYFRREAAMTFCTTGWFGRLFIKTNLMLEPYVGFEPDILLNGNDALDLKPYGVEGIVRHTPGHTAGSISILLASNEALVGDLIASGILLGGLIMTNKAKRPPFEDDALTVAAELRGMVGTGMTKFFMGHGGPLDASEVARHADRLAAGAMSDKNILDVSANACSCPRISNDGLRLDHRQANYGCASAEGN
ncbi:MAG: MBL fold metallo-hydrolase [Burkholderiales bacterium RIFCSPLOWO2_02_FULL_57_36]|nr:MAG: MBL fold metallo-hydrolase [Burkholderiales bacterium RIFCSPLOWO2_02_FULL_57_36]